METFVDIFLSVLGLILTVVTIRIEAQNRKRDKMEALESERRQEEKEAAQRRRQEEAELARQLHEKEILEQRQHEDAERRIQWTIQAYQNLYLNSLVNIEKFGTPDSIKKKFGKPLDYKGEWKKEVKNTDSYKDFRQYVDQIEVFAKGVYQHDLYNLDTFLKLADPYFDLICSKRIQKFFESTSMGSRAYENCKHLMEDADRYHKTGMNSLSGTAEEYAENGEELER